MCVCSYLVTAFTPVGGASVPCGSGCNPRPPRACPSMTQAMQTPTNQPCVIQCHASCFSPSPLFVSIQWLALPVLHTYCTCIHLCNKRRWGGDSLCCENPPRDRHLITDCICGGEKSLKDINFKTLFSLLLSRRLQPFFLGFDAIKLHPLIPTSVAPGCTDSLPLGRQRQQELHQFWFHCSDMCT